MRARSRPFTCGIFIQRGRAVSTAVLAAALALAARSFAGPTQGGALERFLARPGEELPAYLAVRRLEASNARFHKHAWLTAVTEYRDRRFRYEVTAHGGSEMVLRRVLLAALDAERQALARDPRRGALNTDNYRFDMDTPGRVRLTPRRADPMLVAGYVLLDADGDLTRLEGTLAKPPSFWITGARIEREYRRIAGRRVPVRMTSRASVRFAGESSFVMTYEYLEIEGARLAPVAAEIGAGAASR